jgi:hypothetical protein
MVALVFDIQGSVTATGGVAAGRGIVESIARVQLSSRRNGILGILSGEELYNLGLMFFPGAARKDETEAGGGTAGFTLLLPLYATADDLVRVTIEFGALADFHTTATAYTGTVRVAGVYESSPPQFLAYYRHFDIGVITASGTFQVIPDIVRDAKNVEMMGVYLETYTGTLDVTPDDALDRVELKFNTETILDMQQRTVKSVWQGFETYISAALSTGGLTTQAGLHLIPHSPIVNNEATVLTLINGTTATIAGSQGVFLYRALLEARAPEVVVQ